MYVYGYLNRIRSSRLLEREAQRNVEVMWLLRRLTPDFKTIADLRRDNRQALRQVCREFTLWRRELGLFGGELIAIDGSKFKAVNARQRNFSARKVQSLTQEVEAKIEHYIEELEAQDAQCAEVRQPTAEELQQKIEILKERMRNLRAQAKQMAQTGASQVSLTDPDSRSMPAGKGHGADVGYNVQVSVDARHKLILDHEVPNTATDQGHLSTMALEAKELLGVAHLEAAADMGYYDGKEVKACLQARIAAYLPKPNTSANRKLGPFGKEDFHYDRRGGYGRAWNSPSSWAEKAAQLFPSASWADLSASVLATRTSITCCIEGFYASEVNFLWRASLLPVAKRINIYGETEAMPFGKRPNLSINWTEICSLDSIQIGAWSVLIRTPILDWVRQTIRLKHRFSPNRGLASLPSFCGISGLR